MLGNNLKANDECYDNIIEKIALKESYFELLDQRYTSVAGYIDEHKSELIKNIAVYPQGSVKQGTVIKYRENNSFDVDVVIEFESDLYRNSQKKIRTEIEKLLLDYKRANGIKKNLEENKRSYSMVYSDSEFYFNIDFTPVIKYNSMYYLTNNTSSVYNTPSLELERTNPKAFYKWFNAKNTEKYQMFYKKEFEQLERSNLTKLQKSIMITKYSKDLMLNSSLKSIILTVVMADTFNYCLSYEENFKNFKKELIKKYSENYVKISNPTEPSENFAEKFNQLSKEEKDEFVEALEEWELVGEEFYGKSDYSHAQEFMQFVDNEIQIEGEYIRKGFRFQKFESGEKVKKGMRHKARFSVDYINIKDYSIEWQVTNEAKSARKNNSNPRGQIESKYFNLERIEEPLSFAGQHWVRCILTNKYSQEVKVSPKFKVNII